MRDKTRRERYDEKKRNAKVFPISLVCVNFQHDGNFGYLIRAAACFGAECIHVIGSVPTRSAIDSLSGICKDSKPITVHHFNFDSHVALVVGNEQIGIPVEILQNSEVVYIPMPGVGYCLNTSQTANIMLYEATKQYENMEISQNSWNDWECYHLP